MTHKTPNRPTPAFVAAVDSLAARTDMPALRAAVQCGDVHGALDVAERAPEPPVASRRAILAGMAAAAVLPVVGAKAKAAEPVPPDGFHKITDAGGKVWFAADAPDPIFAAMEAHRDAHAKWMAAIDVRTAAEDRFHERHGTVRPSVVLVDRRSWEARNSDYPWPFGDQNERRLYCGHDIDQHLPFSRERRAEFRAQLAAQHRDFRATVRVADQQAFAAGEHEADAMLAIAETEPTTLAGIVAVLAHVREFDPDYQGVFNDRYDEHTFLENIETALRKIAAI